LNRQERQDDAKVAKRNEPDELVDRWANAGTGAAIEVHRPLGQGFVESVYEEALCLELQRRAIPFEPQASIAVAYKGHLVGQGRVDILVAGMLIVELRAVDVLLPIHVAQMLSYLSATNLRLGLLINSKVSKLGQGVKRVIRSWLVLTSLASPWRLLGVLAVQSSLKEESCPQ
jgi:GxxExxY protein